MKTKDIDVKAVLKEFAKHQGKWAFWETDGRLGWNFNMEKMDHEYHSDIMTPYPFKLTKSFFSKMIKKGYLGGCDCGCRGDFEITDKGLELIGEVRTKPYNGY